MSSSNGFSSSGASNSSVLGNSLNSSANLNSLNNASIDPGLQVANAGNLSRAAAGKWDDFEVVGSKIYDPDGREFIAKGVNINGPGFGWPGDTPNQVDNVKKWGFNSIRLNIRELGLEIKNRYAQNGTVDQIVRNFTKEGIVVMIDIHEKGGSWYDSDELKKLVSYSKELGSKYKDNPYVWINVTNEPGGHDSGKQPAINNYLNQYTTTIKEIRSTGFDNPIVVDGWFWGQDKGVWDSRPVQDDKSAILSLGPKVLAADPLKNTLFSFHAYDQWRFDTENVMNNFIDRIHDKGLAVVVGEYGARSKGATPGDTLRDTVVGTLASTQQKEVGRFAWAWWGGDAFDLANGGKGGAFNAKFNADGSMPSNLTWYGEKLWQDNRRPENLQVRSGSGGSKSPNPVSLRYEAEDLSLTGYQIEGNSSASGDQQISLLNSGSTSGTASGVFNGASGNYNIKIKYLDETDGAGRGSVNVAGQSGSFDLDRRLKVDTAIEEVVLSKVQLQSGDRFEISGTANDYEWARIDWIEFTPV